MHKHSMDDVQKILNELLTLSGQLRRGENVAILHAIAYEPGWAENERVSAYATEVLKQFPH